MLSVLWDSLLDLDDLSASTNSIMELMGTLLSFSHSSSASSTSHSSSVELINLVPRLWPFLGHNINSVRRSSLQALVTLLSLGDVSTSNGPQTEATSTALSAEGVMSKSSEAWLSVLLQPLLCQIFQRFLLEGGQENRKLLYQVSVW